MIRMRKKNCCDYWKNSAFNHVEELRKTLGIKVNEECLVTFAMGLSDRKYLSPAVKLNRKVEYR